MPAQPRTRFHFRIDLATWMTASAPESAEMRRRYYAQAQLDINGLASPATRLAWSDGALGATLPAGAPVVPWVNQYVFGNFGVGLEAVDRPYGSDDVTYYVVYHNGQEIIVCVHSFMVRRTGTSNWLMSSPAGMPQRAIIGSLAVDMQSW